MPKHLQTFVARHDQWYAEILDILFDRASEGSESLSNGNQTFSILNFRYLSANLHPDLRKNLLAFLLHPHVRSLRVRAALGRRDLRLVVKELPSKQLECRPPDVFGTYFLQGRSDSGDGSHPRIDLGYVGQAAGVSSNDGIGLGCQDLSGSYIRC